MKLMSSNWRLVSTNSLIAFLASVVCLAGCAPNTAAGVREEAAVTSEIRIGKNYQAVYRELKEELSRCYERGDFTATREVRGELYTEIRQAELTYGLYGGAIDLYLVVDIEGVGPSDSTITTYESIKRRVGAENNYIDALENFLTTGEPMCKKRR